jgi:NADPH:quinone reductase-like Zn-dependent oxidoreductase
MMAAYLTRRAGPQDLELGELPQPRPGKGEVLLAVHAAAITPTEFNWSPTFQARDGAPRPFPIILGHEFAGVIVDAGAGSEGVKPGDAMYGMNDWFTNGAQAEYCVAPATALAPRPRALDPTTAAVVPISALTAWQGLFERCQLKAGERVLVHGGAGGVGVFAVQLAHWRGARVTATASTRNVDFVRRLGADEVVDYRTTRYEKVVRDIDVVFDAVGGETLDRSWDVLRSGGRLVTIAAQSEAMNDPRARDAFFIVSPSREQLSGISSLLDAGALRAFVGAVFRLDQARDAYAHAQRGGMRGKVALRVKNGA